MALPASPRVSAPTARSWFDGRVCANILIRAAATASAAAISPGAPRSPSIGTWSSNDRALTPSCVGLAVCQSVLCQVFRNVLDENANDCSEGRAYCRNAIGLGRGVADGRRTLCELRGDAQRRLFAVHPAGA